MFSVSRNANMFGFPEEHMKNPEEIERFIKSKHAETRISIPCRSVCLQFQMY